MKHSPANPDTVTLPQWLAAASLWALAAYGLLAPPSPATPARATTAPGCLTVR